MITQPFYWKKEYPAYHTLAGWQMEKSLIFNKVKMQLRYSKYATLLIKAELLFKAAHAAKDTDTMLKYSEITEWLYSRQMPIAEILIFEYNEKLV